MKLARHAIGFDHGYILLAQVDGDFRVGPSERSARPCALTVTTLMRRDGGVSATHAVSPFRVGDVYRLTDTHDPVCLITCPW